jgi:hypothetical protein
LDYGAGKQTLEAYVKERISREVKWTNYDPGIPGIDTIPTGQYDLVITSDVLEHVEPPRIEATIAALGKLTFKVLYSNIACTATGKLFGEGPYKGQDLHLIVEPPSWWREQFKEFCPLKEFSYRHEEFPQRGNPVTRCVMLHERV